MLAQWPKLLENLGALPPGKEKENIQPLQELNSSGAPRKEQSRSEGPLQEREKALPLKEQSSGNVLVREKESKEKSKEKSKESKESKESKTVSLDLSKPGSLDLTDSFHTAETSVGGGGGETCRLCGVIVASQHHAR